MAQPTKKGGPSTKKGTARVATNAVQMLEQDHRAVERLFKEFASGDATRKEEVARKIFQELEAHATLEEEIFYPALRNQADLGELGELEQGDREIDSADVMDQGEMDEDQDNEDDETADEMGEDVIDAAYEDHQAVKELIGKLRGLTVEEPEFSSGMAELQELVTNHVSEEEEILFAEAKLKLDLAVIGQELQERKEALAHSHSS